MFSAAFINKINFRLTYLFICVFPCNEIIMKIGVCIFLQQMDMILIYGVYGKVENLPNRESLLIAQVSIGQKFGIMQLGCTMNEKFHIWKLD